MKDTNRKKLFPKIRKLLCIVYMYHYSYINIYAEY